MWEGEWERGNEGKGLYKVTLTSRFANGINLINNYDKQFAEMSVLFPRLLSCLKMCSMTEYHRDIIMRAATCIYSIGE